MPPGASTLVRPAFEADLTEPMPPMTVDSSFEAVSNYAAELLSDLGAPNEIIDPQVVLMESRWFADNPEHAAANRKVILEAVAASPDLLAIGGAICRTTGVHLDPVVLVTANNLQDIDKPPELSRQSQNDKQWQASKRVAMMLHVLLSKKTIENSALPEYFKGKLFRQQVANVVGEHHGRQPEPSLQYGCGYRLDLESRLYRDILAPADWFGAKFYRNNPGNLNKLGQPLLDEERSQEFATYLRYLYDGPDGYWYVSDQNNPGRIVLAAYEALRENHPSRLTGPDHAFSGDMSLLDRPREPYIDVTTLDFDDPDALSEQLGLAT